MRTKTLGVYAGIWLICWLPQAPGGPSYYALFQPILIVPSLEFSDVEACGPDTFNQV